jgi:hypothetical protein
VVVVVAVYDLSQRDRREFMDGAASCVTRQGTVSCQSTPSQRTFGRLGEKMG